MPNLPMRACANTWCPETVQPPEKYCPGCKPEAEAQDRRRRGSANERGYTYRWQKLRLRVLKEEPLCRECAKAGRVVLAEHVDHIDGDVTNMSRENLQPLCAPCHSRKTAKENGAFGNAKKGGRP